MKRERERRRERAGRIESGSDGEKKLIAPPIQ